MKPDNATTETNSPVEQEKTESDSTPPVSESDVTAQPRQNEETLGVTKTPSPLPELETSKEYTDATETTTEQIIREISYMEHSDDFHSVKSSSDVPSNFKTGRDFECGIKVTRVQPHTRHYSNKQHKWFKWFVPTSGN